MTEGPQLQYRKEVGRRIRLAREAMGLEEKELAKLLDITYTAWNNYERGIRPVNHFAVHRFATRYDVSLDYLLSGKREKLRHELLLKIEALEASEASSD